MFFPYPDALHALNRLMAIKCAEMALALAYLQILCGPLQAAARRNPRRSTVQWQAY
jgi:hypothetical protein